MLMVTPNLIRMHCSRCIPSLWILLPREDVDIVWDLEMDSLVLNTVCPRCKQPIKNSRSVGGK